MAPHWTDVSAVDRKDIAFKGSRLLAYISATPIALSSKAPQLKGFRVWTLETLETSQYVRSVQYTCSFLRRIWLCFTAVALTTCLCFLLHASIRVVKVPIAVFGIPASIQLIASQCSPLLLCEC